jgi:hypothetical protein
MSEYVKVIQKKQVHPAQSKCRGGGSASFFLETTMYTGVKQTIPRLITVNPHGPFI